MFSTKFILAIASGIAAISAVNANTGFGGYFSIRLYEPWAPYSLISLVYSQQSTGILRTKLDVAGFAHLQPGLLHFQGIRSQTRTKSAATKPISLVCPRNEITIAFRDDYAPKY